jgi:murein DD-endopeptidase MepM/ murein hydrolase activator NlpD
MNFKTRNSNITKVLYIVLVLCIVSILFLSIYSIFNQNETPNDTDNQHNLNLNNGSENTDGEETALDFFNRNRRETEPATEPPTQRPDNPPGRTEQPRTAPTEPVLQAPAADPDPQEEVPVPTDRTADFIADPIADAIEVLSVPSLFIRPVQGHVFKRHSPDTAVYCIAMNDFRTHIGIDIDSEVGVNVRAVSDGVVSAIYEDPLLGKTVVIDHYGGIQSVYRNLQEAIPRNIAVGAAVKGGDVIGGVGQTALIKMGGVPCLHFEMKKDGEHVDPFDYIGF